MNDNARAWVDALRSGEYTQTKTHLQDSKGYCCLGVACDLAVKAGIISPGISVPGDDKVVYADKGNKGVPEVYVLTNKVRDWLGLDTVNGAWNDIDTLSAMNDQGYTFEQIADQIEAEPEGLFV